MFDAYRVAVKLSLVNHVSTGLALITSELGGVNKALHGAQISATAFEKQLRSIKTLGLVGGGMAALGYGMLSMFKAPLDEAKKFDQAIGKFKLFGMSDAVNLEAVKFAKSMNVMGSSYTENMKLMTEAQGVFRESGMSGSHALEGSKLAAPFLAKIAFATSSLDGESSAKLKTSSLAMLRYVEMSGGLASPDRFKKIADSGWKMAQTSGGAVDWEQLRQYKARAGVAGQYMTDEGMAMLEPIIAELKGSTAGFAARTSFNRLNGIIKIPNQVAHELVKSGVWDGSKVSWNSQGGIKSFNGNPLKDSELMMKNPVSFYEKNIMPMYEKMGLKTPESRARENAMIFGSTGGNMFTLIDRQLPAIHRSLEAWNKALTVEASVDVAKKTLSGKEVDLHAKWKDVMNILGTAILPLAIRGVESMISALTSFKKFAKDHPGIVKGMAVAFVGLGAALAFGGTVLLLSAGMKGLGLAFAFLKSPSLALGGGLLRLLGNGIIFIGRALLMNPIGLIVTGIAVAAYLLYKNWSTVGPYVMKIWEVIRYIAVSSFEYIWQKIKVVSEFIKPVFDFYVSVWSRIFSVVKDGVSGTFNFVSNCVTGLWNALKNSPIGRLIGGVAGVTGSVINGVANSVSGAATSLYKDAYAYNHAPGVGAPPQQAAPVFKVENKMDKYGIATMITQIQGQDMSRPPSGPRGHDGNMSLSPVGLGFVGM